MKLCAVLLLVGCIQDPTVDCGNHRCPAGKLCTATSCATPEEVAACVGLDDRAACTTGDIPVGACGDGACHAVECGDGVADAAEVCDDGNNVAADGCSALCDSTETCGNGVVDLINRESCDDGSLGRSQDGCSSGCQTELATWSDITPGPISARASAGSAYDSDRGRVVLFGGAGINDISGDTWEWEPNAYAWQRRFPARSPSSRSGAVLVYDPVRRVTLLFGGTTGSGISNETWTWDGENWTELHPTTSPPPRLGTAMAYDAARDRTILFGGETTTAVFDDTWAWDGANWSRLQPAVSPHPRTLHAMAYDPSRMVIVLVSGGETITGTPMIRRDVWEWNGTTWSLKEAGSGPPYLAGALAYDGLNNTMMFFGGRQMSGSPSSQTWHWNGTGWTVDSAGNPTARYGAMLVSAAGFPVLFGGRDGAMFFADTVNWTVSGWVPPSISDVGPRPRNSATAAYDTHQGRLILVGGYTNQQESDTWAWADAVWTRLSAGTTAPFGAMAYDAHRDRIVRVGTGSQAGTYELVADTWLKTPAMPLAVVDVALTYDTERRTTLLFGPAATQAYSLTCTWDGTSWTIHNPAVSPSQRYSVALAFDPLRQRAVLFGGRHATDATALGDTWEWDGTSWELRTTSGPPPRVSAHLVYDPQRQRVVLSGGTNDSLGYDDVWEWDGVQWEKRDTLAPPPRRSGDVVFYDLVGRQLVRFGGIGITGGTRHDDVWSLRYSAPLQPDERCRENIDEDGDTLAGCADPDCAARCSSCGNGTCDPLEDVMLCPADCN